MPFNVNALDLSAVTTGTGASHVNQGFNTWTLFTQWNGAVSAGTIVLEGSPDNGVSGWAVLATRTFAASTNFADTVSTSLKYIRCRISVTVAGGNLTAWIAALGPLPNDAS
jgi:hypothetical protein